MKRLKEEQIKRIKTFKPILWVLVLGLIYLVWVRITGLRIPCFFYVITHKFCPGCGITRMVVALTKFDFKAAFSHNALVLLLLPFLCGIFIYKTVKYIKDGTNRDPLPIKIFYIAAFVLCVVFWILRNTQNFSWLAP